MLFTIGLIAFIIGKYVIIDPNPFRTGWRDVAGVLVAMIGALLMLVSICIMLWRFLP